MRKLTNHLVPGAGVDLNINVADEPGPGGANHVYAVAGEGFSALIKFQKGGVKEINPVTGQTNGINGLTQEALLAILIDRMRGFQSGKFSCRENAIVLTHLEEALLWLKERTSQRLERGVEGKEVK